MEHEEFGVEAKHGYLTEEELRKLVVLKQMVSTYYGFQKVRVGIDNRLAGVIKEYIDYGKVAKRLKEEADDTEIEEFESRFGINVRETKTRELIKKMKGTSIGNMEWLINKYFGMGEIIKLAYIVKDAKEVENRIEKEVKSFIKNYEIYNQWLKYVKGVGVMLSASLISAIRTPLRFKNVSKLWQYSGLGHIYYCTECDKYITVSRVMEIFGKEMRVTTFGGMNAAKAHAEGHGLKYEDCIYPIAQKRVYGIQSNWSNFVKMTCWKIGNQFIRQGRYYRHRYDEFKKYEEEKAQQPQLRPLKLAIGWIPYDEDLRKKFTKKFSCPNPDCGYVANKPLNKCPKCGMKAQVIITEARAKMLRDMGYDRVEVVPTGLLINNRAMRKTVKLFLAHLWDKWCRLEGYEPPEPYSSKFLRHNYYPPPEPDGGKI